MNNTYIADWRTIIHRFERWWNREKTDRPLMRIIAEGKRGAVAPLKEPSEPRDLYLDVELILGRYRNYFETHYFLADAYPSVNVDLGPGSMALYLGGEPEFSWETVWFKEFVHCCKAFEGIRYDEHNKWWTLHRDMIRKAVELSRGDFYINIPDIIENLDILSAMRGPQELCYDIAEYPDIVHAGVEKIDGVYFRYYDGFYDIVKDTDGSSSFTGFNVPGAGKTAKLQCDFSAMISPDMFREFALPSLRKQCQKMAHSIYLYDGYIEIHITTQFVFVNAFLDRHVHYYTPLFPSDYDSKYNSDIYSGELDNEAKFQAKCFDENKTRLICNGKEYNYFVGDNLKRSGQNPMWWQGKSFKIDFSKYRVNDYLCASKYKAHYGYFYHSHEFSYPCKSFNFTAKLNDFRSKKDIAYVINWDYYTYSSSAEIPGKNTFHNEPHSISYSNNWTQPGAGFVITINARYTPNG